MISKIKFNIEGMSCSHCVASVKKAISSIEGILSVDVNLEEKYAIVEGENPNINEIIEAIDEEGYTASI